MTESKALSRRPSTPYLHLLGRGRLRHLQLLVAIAETGSLKRAAELIAVSQPAATQALSELEQVLGIRLFERHARGVSMTAAGQELIPVVRQILRVLRETTDALVGRQINEEIVRIGILQAASFFLAKPLVTELRLGYSAFRVQVEEDTLGSLLTGLNAGTLDIVVSRYSPQLSDSLEFEELISDQMYILCGMHHPMSKKRNLKIQDLQNEVWMLPPKSTLVRQMFDKEIAPVLGPKLIVNPISTSSIEVHKEILTDNQTVSVVPRSIGLLMCSLGYARSLKIDSLPTLESLYVITKRDAIKKLSVVNVIETLRVARERGGWVGSDR